MDFAGVLVAPLPGACVFGFEPLAELGDEGGVEVGAVHGVGAVFGDERGATVAVGGVEPDLHDAGGFVVFGFGAAGAGFLVGVVVGAFGEVAIRSEEHTSELQSRENLVCRLL